MSPVIALLVGCMSISFAITPPETIALPPDKSGSTDEKKEMPTAIVTPVFSIDGQEYPLTLQKMNTELGFFAKMGTSKTFLDDCELNRMFDIADTNKNGVLKKAELMSFQMKVFHDAGDGSKDDELSQVEFKALLDNMNLDGEDGLYAGEMYAYLKHNGFLT